MKQIKSALRFIPVAVAAVALGLALPGGAAQAQGSPTCQGVFDSDLVNHGQHIVGDYVTGTGGISGDLAWPPAGQVGGAVGGNGGALVPGGPGPGFHFPNDFAPGASFCLEQAHPNGFDVPAPHLGDGGGHDH